MPRGADVVARGRTGPGRRRLLAPDQLAEIARLVLDGQSQPAIAAAMGLKVSQVKQAIALLRADGVELPARRGRPGRHAMHDKAPVWKRLPCLGCGTVFDSTGPGNRLCGDCRGREAPAEHALHIADRRVR